MKQLILLTLFHVFVLSLCPAQSRPPAAEAVRGTLCDALPDAAWEGAEWLSVADAPVVTGRVDEDSRAADGANWFVCTVRNSQRVTRALWMTTSLGVNELYVNGRRIGREVLRPGFSHHSRTKYSFTYDVTDAFLTKRGSTNTLSAQVTPGWWADKIITPSGSHGMYGQKCAFRGVLQLTFADGSTRRYATNAADWKAGIAGPVTHAAIFDGEAYDARIPLGFLTPEKLGTPEVSKEYKGVVVPENGAEVYQLDRLALMPKRAYVYSRTDGATDAAYGKIVIDREYAPGTPMTVRPGEHLVVDFGQNCAAVPSFRFRAKGGTRLTCLPAELLNDGNGAKDRGMDGAEGSIHRRNLRIHKRSIRLDYTFADTPGSAALYTPRCTFFGYRYADITVTGEVVIEQLLSVPVSSITPDMETGHITTGNSHINQLIANTLWGMRSNYLSVPTDCPQRNERLGWTADTQVFCETGTFFARTDRFFHKWLRDLRDSQNEAGGFPGVAPPGQYGSWTNEYMRLGWADAGIIVPWTIWKQFGDATVVDDSWASMQRYMAHVHQTKYAHQALSSENGNYQWGDWLSYEPLESCGGSAFKDGQPLPEAIEYWNYLGASYWAIDAAMMADMASATGRDAQPYLAMAAEAKAYLRQRFFNADGTFVTPILNTMQTPALFALRNNLFSGAAKAQTVARLRENIRQHGNCLQTGFLGTSILMPTLTENGLSDVAYTLLFQRKNPSWLYSVDNGATTVWERWNSYMKEKGMGPNGMNSFNHYAYGVVCQWLWQTCAGIAADPAQPGFKHIVMKPVPDRRLGHLDASYRSAAGLIESHWRYEGSKWVWTFTIPEGATATVTLPGEQSRDYAAGTYTLTRSATATPVVLVAGQSNADGRVPLSSLPEELKTYKYCQWSYGSGDFETATGLFAPYSPRVAKPGIEGSWGFDAVLYHKLEALWQRPFYVIKHTDGGTAIDPSCQGSTHGLYWSADRAFLDSTASASHGGRSLLKAFCRQIDDCLGHLPADYDIRCLIWHQGESDQRAAGRYYQNLKAVVGYIRQHLAEQTGQQRYARLPVVCGTFSKDSRQGSAEVADALRRLASEDADFYVVEATDLPLLNDRLHFNAQGAQTLGQRVFDVISQWE